MRPTTLWRNGILTAVMMLAGARANAVTTWTGDGGDGAWNNTANWDNGVPSKTVTDTAIFDDGSATGTTITWGTGSANRPKNTNFSFVAGAQSYNLAGSEFIDNQSNTRTVTTAVGMANNQTFTTTMRFANHTITMDGSGDIFFNQMDNTNVWGDTTTNTGGWAVNHADAVLTVDGFTQLRKYTMTKSGVGTLVLSGTIDFGYGFNGATFVSTLLQTSGATPGTIDLSAATINLEAHLDLGEALVSGQTYTLVNYTNATLIGTGTTGFASVTGDLPSGWGVLNDTGTQRIVLTEIPEPASLMLCAAGAVLIAGRRRNRA